MIFSCKQATEALSEAMDHPLSPWRRLRLEAHVLICGRCRRFRTQIKMLRMWCAELARREGAGEIEGAVVGAQIVTLPEAARERLRRVLRE